MQSIHAARTPAIRRDGRQAGQLRARGARAVLPLRPDHRHRAYGHRFTSSNSGSSMPFLRLQRDGVAARRSQTRKGVCRQKPAYLRAPRRAGLRLPHRRHAAAPLAPASTRLPLPCSTWPLFSCEDMQAAEICPAAGALSPRANGGIEISSRRASSPSWPAFGRRPPAVRAGMCSAPDGRDPGPARHGCHTWRDAEALPADLLQWVMAIGSILAGRYSPATAERYPLWHTDGKASPHFSNRTERTLRDRHRGRVRA